MSSPSYEDMQVVKIRGYYEQLFKTSWVSGLLELSSGNFFNFLLAALVAKYEFTP